MRATKLTPTQVGYRTTTPTYLVAGSLYGLHLRACRDLTVRSYRVYLCDALGDQIGTARWVATRKEALTFDMSDFVKE